LRECLADQCSLNSYLVEIIVKGVPEQVQVVLGKRGFTIDDILSLPRLEERHLSEVGVYVDMVKGSAHDNWYVI
jgi:hypothetical protein